MWTVGMETGGGALALPVAWPVCSPFEIMEIMDELCILRLCKEYSPI